MTARRCVDARLSMALSFLFFVPAVNYLLMIVLCFAPSRATEPIDPWTQDRLRLRSVAPRRRLFASIGAGAAVTREPVKPGEVGGMEDLISADGDLRTLPCHLPEQGGMDGFYAARLIKA